jgi:hypothetical protein
MSARARIGTIEGRTGIRSLPGLDAALAKIDASHLLVSPKKSAAGLDKGAGLVVAAKKIADKD